MKSMFCFLLSIAINKKNHFFFFLPKLEVSSSAILVFLDKYEISLDIYKTCLDLYLCVQNYIKMLLKV